MASVERQVLLAPDVVARAAARLAPLPEQGWMLSQPRALRRHFVRHVFDHADMDRRRQIWMLTQTDEVRDSFVAEVLERQDPRPHEEIWMLRQDLDVRESYVHDVLLADGPLESPGRFDSASED